MPKDKTTTFGARAKSWAAKQGLHGPQAFFRFVIFTYLDCLSKESDEFIFKGGNLLWLYTHTPRQTVDLDLVTRTINETNKVKALLGNACRHAEGVEFNLKSIKEVSAEGFLGAAVTMGYATEDGASNSFDLDIVYVLPTKTTVLQSPIPGQSTIHSATLENVVADKISACHRFGSGNTRMKDYDDLWRLAAEKRKVDWKVIKSLLTKHGNQIDLRNEWINDEMNSAWKRHIRRYKDLPEDLTTVLNQINQWIKLED